MQFCGTKYGVFCQADQKTHWYDNYHEANAVEIRELYGPDWQEKIAVRIRQAVAATPLSVRTQRKLLRQMMTFTQERDE